MTARTIWLAVTLLAIAALRLIWPPPDGTRRDFVFEVMASSLAPAVMQLYYQREDDLSFNEAASVRVELRTNTLTLHRFPLPAGHYRGLRFDPLEAGSGTLRFAQPRIVSAHDGRVRAELPVSTWSIGQNIQQLTAHEGVLEVEIRREHADPALLIPLPTRSLVLQPSRTAQVLASLGVIALALGLLRVIPRVQNVSGLILRPLAHLERAIQRNIPRDHLPLDRFGIAFLLLVFVAGVIAAAAGIHGSSTSIRSRTGVPAGEWRPQVGTPKNIRSDEWSIHTPFVLHQANRTQRFAVEPSLIGPDNTTLIGNAPVRHWTTLFRPQYWGFFVLPTANAFAAYWQAKTVLLVAGTFLLFLLLARSSKLAAFGSVWFYFSSYTQWAFSWPAMLPEMIGTAALSVVAACLMFVTASRGALVVLALVFVGASMNFVLCAYPPFQVPLLWAAAGCAIAWLVEHLRARSSNDVPAMCWKRGFLAAGITVAATTVLALLFLREIGSVVEITAQTIYPGSRSLSGGGVTWAQFVSTFADLWKTETRVPPEFMNICEGTGYYWLGILSLALAWPLIRARERVEGRRLYLVLFAPLLLLLIWAAVDVPAEIGRMLFLDRVQSTRVIPAIGLINVAITLVFLRSHATAHRAGVQVRMDGRSWVVLGVATAATFLLLVAMNRSIQNFFALPELAIVAAGVGLAMFALARGAAVILAMLVLAPLIWFNLLINPVDRGLGIYEDSALRRFVDSHPCKDGRWLVVTENGTAPMYFAALGLDVFNVLHFVPVLDAWRKFDPTGAQAALYNGSGMAVVRALPPGSEAQISALEGAGLGPPIFRRLGVDPADARLRELGIRYYAFHGADDGALFPERQFERLHDAPVDGFMLYRIRDR